jgi:hypothetical protein
MQHIATVLAKRIINPSWTLADPRVSAACSPQRRPRT